MLGVGCATTSLHVSLSACNFRDAAFAAAARVAAAGLQVAAPIKLMYADGVVPPPRTLVMLANQWTAAPGSAAHYFQQQMDQRDNAIHALSVQIMLGTYGRANIGTEEVPFFGPWEQTKQQLRDPSSPSSLAMTDCARKILVKAQPFEIGGRPADGASYLAMLRATIAAANACLKENDGILRVPGALSAIQASCAYAESMTLTDYTSTVSAAATRGSYLTPAAWLVMSTQAGDVAWARWRGYTDRWRGVMTAEVEASTARLTAAMQQTLTRAVERNTQVGLQVRLARDGAKMRHGGWVEGDRKSVV